MSLYFIQFSETFLLAFVTFFATVSPINTLIIFMSLTGNHTSHERKNIALKAIVISGSILIAVMFVGAVILQFLGISLAAVRTAGGVLLLLTGIGMVFGDDKERVSDKSLEKKDITVFPLAVPIIAGPAAITTSMLFFQKINDTIILKGAVFIALLVNLLITLILLLLSDRIIKLINKSVIAIFLRIAGLILASLAFQFIFDGLKESGIFNKL
jgi:multiple antibiotic resistance protein